jgi:hypothetical protein
MGYSSSVGVLPLLAIALLVPAAAGAREQTRSAPPSPLVFLTRDGCVNTSTMRARLDAALTRLKLPKDYAVIDADTLAEGDVRRGYGTPTVLYDSRDLFGMPEPTPPVSSPT